MRSEQDLVVHRTRAEDGTPVERRFTVDTLEAEVAFPFDTEATSEARESIAREGSTLLARARRP
jgi:hypothetical protein